MVSLGRLGVLAVLLAACTEATAPPVGGPLTGSWGTLPIPSGSFTLLTLQTGAGRVVGNAEQWGIANRYLGSFVIAGAYHEADRSFSLAVLRGGWPSATFVGRWSADSLVGTWTDQYGSGTTRFARQPT